jgi:hypothetical protein
MTPSQVLKMLPSTARVENMRPMNIFHQSKLDEFANRLPLSRLIARMMVVTGRKL